MYSARRFGSQAWVTAPAHRRVFLLGALIELVLVSSWGNYRAGELSWWGTIVPGSSRAGAQSSPEFLSRLELLRTLRGIRGLKAEGDAGVLLAARCRGRTSVGRLTLPGKPLRVQRAAQFRGRISPSPPVLRRFLDMPGAAKQNGETRKRRAAGGGSRAVCPKRQLTVPSAGRFRNRVAFASRHQTRVLKCLHGACHAFAVQPP